MTLLVPNSTHWPQWILDIWHRDHEHKFIEKLIARLQRSDSRRRAVEEALGGYSSNCERKLMTKLAHPLGVLSIPC